MGLLCRGVLWLCYKKVVPREIAKYGNTFRCWSISMLERLLLIVIFLFFTVVNGRKVDGLEGCFPLSLSSRIYLYGNCTSGFGVMESGLLLSECYTVQEGRLVVSDG